MSTARAVAAVCVAFTLGACGASTADDDAEAEATPTTPATTQPSAAATSPARTLDFGSEYRFPSGLVVTVNSPNSFTPSESAYPRSERAAAFNIEVSNESAKAYRLTNFSVHAAIAGEELEQVQDPTRGYNGIVDADRDIPSEKSVELTVAFAVEPEQATLRLTVAPDPNKPYKAVFVGSA